MPPTRAEVAYAEPRNTAQPLHLLPKPGLGAGVENVQFKLAQLLQVRPRLQLVDGCKRIDLPKRRLGPQPVKTKRQLTIFDRQFKIRQTKIPLQPLKKCRLENASAPIKRITRKPDQLRLVEPQPPRLFQLFPQLVHTDQIAQAHGSGAIEQRERGLCLGEILPDKLQHEQLVEIRIEEGPRNRIQLPVVVMRAPGNIDNHDESTLSQPRQIPVSSPG